MRRYRVTVSERRLTPYLIYAESEEAARSFVELVLGLQAEDEGMVVDVIQWPEATTRGTRMQQAVRMGVICALIAILSSSSLVAAADKPVTASWYSQEACRWNRDPACPTASGKSLYKLERDGVLFAAMWDVPLGARYRVTNAAGVAVDVTILDRGPARRLGRKIDLCRAAYQRLADPKTGTVAVTLTRLP